MTLLGSALKRSFQLRNKLARPRLRPIQYQQKTLRTLLKKAANTAFGETYGFKDILQAENMIAAYQAAVPFFDYDSIYEQWWHRLLQQEEDVTWRGKVKYFAMSSGTSGAPSKYIPVTGDMIRSNRKAALKMFFALSNFDPDPSMFTRDMMLLGGSTNLIDKGGYFVGDLSGINARRRPLWIRGIYKPGEEIAAIRDWHERIEHIARKAPEWKNIGFIGGIPAWNQLMMERIIELHGVESIHDIWPHLSAYVHGGVAFEPYRKSFDRLMRKPLIYLDTYLASEGFMAFQTRPDTRAMALILNNGIFMEFIPFDEQHFQEGQLIGKPRALSVDEVEEGKEYALAISTCAGAWRYLIGDTLRFVDKERMEIVITGRTKHFLSITGEHLSVDNMNQAVQAVMEAMNLPIREFTVAAVSVGEGKFAHRWYIGADEPADARQVGERIDQQLRRVNEDYDIERRHVLQDIQMHVLPSQVFFKYQEMQGKVGGQYKFPRVMKKEQLADWERFLAQQGHL